MNPTPTGISCSYIHLSLYSWNISALKMYIQRSAWGVSTDFVLFGGEVSFEVSNEGHDVAEQWPAAECH